MTRRALRRWSFVHRWTSLVCTLFLLMLCVTGLPLIFHEEIDAAMSTEEWEPARPEGPLLSLDGVLAAALADALGEVPLYMSFDEDRPVVNVTSGPSGDAGPSEMRFSPIDRTSGEAAPPAGGGGVVMDVILRLHTDMFLGLPGMLFLGAMGALFLVAIASGVVLYAPFMRRQAFGTLRRGRTPRLFWLDTHDLLGIVTVAWAGVVGLTGIVNTLETPINEAWRARALADLTAPYEGLGIAPVSTSLDEAVAEAVRAAPGMTLQFVAFPGTDWSSDHHLAVFLHGDTPLTEHLITPVLIDARTGEVAGLRRMPWTSQALSLSRPLHFGDYGGLPLKILWALLDLFTIVVLGSGVYLWLAKGRQGTGVPAGVPA